jgi:hypothetical protein
MPPKEGGYDDKEDEETHKNASAEAAGVVRGLSRSLGRTVARIPMGSVPRRALFRAKRLPVRQVAKISDRLSTGWDWWTSAVESTSNDDTRARTTTRRAGAFVSSVLKNAILGAAVFETYGYIVFKLAPDVQPTGDGKSENGLELQGGDDRSFVAKGSSGEMEYNEDQFANHEDEFARASIAIHFLAGGVGGSVHGIASTVIENPLRGNMTSVLQRLPAMTVHHSLAHSVLFGSYEIIKRGLLSHAESDGVQHFGLEYLASITIAGGFSGQLQHVFSHYTEQLLGITTDVQNPVPLKTQHQAPSTSVGSSFFSTRRMLLQNLSPPALRPALITFLPGAIGFVAFEYGKKITT